MLPAAQAATNAATQTGFALAKGKAGHTVLTVGVAVGGAYLLRRLWQGQVRQQAYDQAAMSPASPEALANALAQAMNPSGWDWLRRMDTTDEAALMAAASRIRDLPAVAGAYRRLFQRELLEDLRQELAPAEYQTFMALIDKQRPGARPPQTLAEIDRIATELNRLITAWGWANTDAILALAIQVRNLSLLRQRYRARFGRDLDQHLQSQWSFSTSDYQSFLRLAGG